MGCSQSKIEAISMSSIKPDTRPRSARHNSLPYQKSDRIVEDCIVIRFVNNSSLENELDNAKLHLVVSTVITFTNYNDCIAYINSIRVEKIFLIVSVIESFLDSIRNLPQVEKIYILHPSFLDAENDTTTSSNTFYDIDNLCKQLKIDVELCELDLIAITTSAPIPTDGTTSANLKKQEASFLYAQLMREILYRLKFENNAKNDFINFCRSHYTDNNEQSRMIDDFEANYRPQKALLWITRQGFIWRVLQRAQRTFEIDIRYKLGFIVKHAHTQLTIFQENNSFMAENLLVAYRGKTMFSEKFDVLIKNNSGGLLSFGNFFTAHINKELEIDFVRHRQAALPNAIGILFEIYVNPTMRSARSPFASLDKVYADENIENNGILFGMSSVFRIDSIEESAFNIWSVKLTLIADEDPQLLRLVAPLRSSEVHANPLSYIGKLFMEMGEYAHTEKFFLGMLQDTSVRSQPRRLVRVHNGLGANYMSKNDYTKALEQYQQALNVSLSYLPPTHTDLAPLYDAIGKSYFQLGEYQKAVENYEQAADLIGNYTQLGNDQFANDLKTRIDSAKKILNSKQ